jgi:hypothetical protein
MKGMVDINFESIMHFCIWALRNSGKFRRSAE